MKVFEKDFDELFNAILTDWKNQFPEADTSQGSLIFIKSACLASALWGLYKYQEWIAAQIFPDTADTDALEHHSWVRGLSRKAGETDAQLLDRLLSYIRRPPAGGNQYDYVKWAKEIGNVTAAWCFPLAQGLGTVDVVVQAAAAATGSEIPSSHTGVSGTVSALSPGKLVDTLGGDFITDAVAKGDVARNVAAGTQVTVTAVDDGTHLSLSADIFTAADQAYAIDSLCTQVKDYVDDVRPVTASVVRVLPPTIQLQDVAMTVTGTGVNKVALADDIEALVAALEPGQTLFVAPLIALAIQAGATNVVVATPAADVVADAYEMTRPGTITVD